MSKKKREQSALPDAEPGRSRPLVPVLLLSVGAVAALLSLFQWMELLVVRAGGTAVCAISSTLDCQKVWDAPFASGVHGALGLPVAGFGLVWALVAFGASLAWTWQLLSGRDGAPQAAAVKLTAWAGLATLPVLLGVSINAGAVCLACLATYVVVAAFAAVALKLVPGPLFPKEGFGGGAKWAGGLAVGAYLVLLGPGLATPKAPSTGGDALAKLPTAGGTTPPRTTPPTTVPARVPATTPQMSHASNGLDLADRPVTGDDQAVAEFLQSLELPNRQSVSNGIAVYSKATVPPGEALAPRTLYGVKDAPVKVVEWVDFRCGACRGLNETMRELKRVVPEGSLALEARNFPLDSECNPNVQMSDGLGIRCTAARATICLEGTKDFWTVRDNLFAAQQSLTKERVLELASAGAMDRKKLEACIASPQTTQRLREDIEYAMRYNPHGTPLLVVNGREAQAQGAGPFLYALALTRGDARSPAFRLLPPPRAFDPHAGHGHSHNGHAAH